MRNDLLQSGDHEGQPSDTPCEDDVHFDEFDSPGDELESGVEFSPHDASPAASALPSAEMDQQDSAGFGADEADDLDDGAEPVAAWDAAEGGLEPAEEAADFAPGEDSTAAGWYSRATESDVPPLDVILLDDELPDGESAVFRRGGVAATLASIALHAWLLMTLSEMIREEPVREWYEPLMTEFHEVSPPLPPDAVIEYELANPRDREMEVRKVLNAASVGQSQSTRPKVESEPKPLVEVDPTLQSAPAYDIPEGVDVDERLVVKGTTGDGLVQLESALDRVTWEIARNLQERKVLVAWLIDASGSLKTQREIIQQRLGRIYGELDSLDLAGQIPRRDRGLLSGVVTFGAQTNFLTTEPTEKFDTIHTAIAEAQYDESGRENIFTAVSQVMQKWGTYRTKNGRRIMLVIVTDEAGDDFSTHLELSIARCRHYGAQAYVIGPAAAFGRRQGFVPYVAPENGQTYQLPVDLGPETAMMENVELPFWFEGPQYNYLSSGFGPYALARLVRETGGIYFMTSMTTMDGLAPTGVYEPQAMRSFEPDYQYGSIDQYRRDLLKHPLRAAVVQASQLSREFKALGTPNLELRVTPENFRQVAGDAQQSVAESQLMIDTVLSAFPQGIETLVDQEPSVRWRMAFCLSYGRLLYQRTRCIEYNAACAWLKSGISPQDVSTRSNHWIFRPADELNYATNLKRQARMGQELLNRVLQEAPGTPWAILAARELRNPPGLRIVERFIPPPTPPTPQEIARRRQIQLARENQPRRPTTPTPRPKPPKLPSL
ncbi:MAG: VWA domain-containing protein [Planctomycetaceae bacterium]|nr:VWA domain-containing protein [Planctomycetaceae bacterium]